MSRGLSGRTERASRAFAPPPLAHTDTGVTPDPIDDAERYQARILVGVSRTFALTIPELPRPLRTAVANAYLLCRIADTIEDAEALTPADRERFHALFPRVVAGAADAAAFAGALAPRLADGVTPAAEQELVARAPVVLALTARLPAPQRTALARCVAIMCDGMARFGRESSLAGLADVPALSRYCYVVAGVVGETLTALFCAHDDALALRAHDMAGLDVSFGQGLQMTNILKDVWEDRQRGACWLPRAPFAARGVDLATLRPGEGGPGFAAAYAELIGIAHAHLRSALEYTLLVPPRLCGIRRFCLIALVLAMRTLRCIAEAPGFTRGSEVKVSRQAVAQTLVAVRLLAGHDRALRRWFARLAEDLPLVDHAALHVRDGGASGPGDGFGHAHGGTALPADALRRSARAE